MNVVEKIITGAIAIGLVTAFGLHAAGIAQVTRAGGNATSKVFGTVEQGK